VDGERSEGVLNMAASTKVLPIMDMSISGAFKAQFKMVKMSGSDLRSSLFELSMSLLVIFKRPPQVVEFENCIEGVIERLVKRPNTF